ncbi:MAG: class I SAM-dependent methyltransferase [Burkholderiales bacterium]|nr:class I SAM-dependent methyltransferase [Burkholderiales bacterium]
MSKYERYDEISKNYDKTRSAVGIEIVLGYILTIPEKLENIKVLDAGCGTGNYAMHLKERLPNVISADFSQGMLNKAKEKYELHNQKNDDLIRCDISDLPFKDSCFDAIICNQSLHHLDDENTGFKNHQKFFAHAFKALKPNGLLIINTITHEQLEDGVWWGKLIKPAVDRMKKRFMPDEHLISLLNEFGFVSTEKIVPTSTIIQEKGYFDPESLYRKEFRDGDSHFSLLTENELNSVFNQLNDLTNNGGLSAYISSRDLLRQRIGQFCYIIARK